MMRIRVLLVAAAACLLLSCGQQRSSSLVTDSSIEAELKQVQAIDNHTHPEKVVATGEQDQEYDALPAEGIQELSLPSPFRENSRYFPEAWHALFDYKYSD